MNTARQYTIFFIFLCFVLAACSTTKSLPPGEKLYTGATVKLEAEDVKTRQRKVLKSDLTGLTRPRPNQRFLGIPIKLSIYNMFSKAKPNSFWGRFRDRYGQPPVLLSTVDVEENVKLLQTHLENKGFFKVKVTGDTTAKGKKGHATYTATAGSQYHINTVRFESDSSDLAQALQQSARASLLQVGNPYDLDVINGERNRIDAYLKEHGFYFFSPNYILVQVDSTNGNNLVDMRVIVKSETPDEARQVYHINNVYIYSNYNLNNARVDTSMANAQFFEGYYVIDRRKRFKPKMFSQAMQFNPGEVYNRTDHNLTLSRLIDLNEFKFTRNRFEPLQDTPKLDAYYYLTPRPKKSLRGEFNATTKSNNMNGTQVSVDWLNRNTFGAGEHLNISAYVGTEVQFGGAWKGYNTYRSGAEMNFAIPRFIIPFFKDVRTRGGFIPRTNIQLGYDLLNRRQLYTLNSYRGGLGYLWKENLQKQHEFYPITINYTQPLNVTQTFRDSIKRYPYLARIIDSQFVLGTTYRYTLNQLAGGLKNINSFYFSGLADLSGNVAGLLTNANANNEKRIMNAKFNQYIKLETDFRYYHRFGLDDTWANRVLVGYGKPYGNSVQLPYIKQFFVGGNNSIRAFRSRSLGPGTYPLLATSDDFFPDQTGDIKLELNTEYRPHISGPLYGAVFIDAGNIWLAKEDPSRPGAKFSSNFINELAIGGGVGLRLDITLFVIRLDVAMPIRRPWEKTPWYFEQLRMGYKEFREDIMYNLAIGYPF